jgi:integrase
LKKILLTDLIAQTREAIKPVQHSKSTVYQYGLAWDELSLFFKSHRQLYFSVELAKGFVQESKAKHEDGTLKEWRFKLRRLSVAILIEVYETGGYIWRLHTKDPNDSLSLEKRTIYTTFQDSLVRAGNGNGTRSLYGIIARQFLTYAQFNLCKVVSELQLDDVRTFIPHIAQSYQKTSMRTALSALRAFLSYLYKTEITENNLVIAVPSSGARRTAIVPTITKDEEDRLLQAIDRSSGIGKRNYAMVLLGIRTGLRSVDIVNLELSSIDWRKGTINIIQQKNRKPISLPLLADVGNALADYILHARLESELPYVFLRCLTPYSKLADCYAISCSVLKKAGVRQERNQRKGFHIFRHSLAAKMLSKEVPLSIISNTLGHGSMSSSKTYLSTDGAHLKACALTLAGIEVAQEELL